MLLSILLGFTLARHLFHDVEPHMHEAWGTEAQRELTVSPQGRQDVLQCVMHMGREGGGLCAIQETRSFKINRVSMHHTIHR